NRCTYFLPGCGFRKGVEAVGPIAGTRRLKQDRANLFSQFMSATVRVDLFYGGSLPSRLSLPDPTEVHDRRDDFALPCPVATWRRGHGRGVRGRGCESRAACGPEIPASGDGE